VSPGMNRPVATARAEVRAVPPIQELIGVDGCQAGWVLAISDPSLQSISFTVVPSLAELISSADAEDRMIAVDVPIGLAEDARRACDVEARRLLRAPRNSSVFPPPCRSALHAPTYVDACAANELACGQRLSRQLWNILPKIREVDEVITPTRQYWVREAHPEVCFATLAATGRGLIHAKKTAEGEAERLALLHRYVPPIDPGAIRLQLGRARVARDDIVDAVVCLVTAYRVLQGLATVLPNGDVPVDARGLRMEMVA
jgi:predicted RNase H-like nuclease